VPQRPERDPGDDVCRRSCRGRLKALESAGDAAEEPVVQATAQSAPAEVHTSAELLEVITGSSVDAPLCFTCGTKMRPAGSCFVCEGCGSTSGCS